jgi:hypothetical protein
LKQPKPSAESWIIRQHFLSARAIPPLKTYYDVEKAFRRAGLSSRIVFIGIKSLFQRNPAEICRHEQDIIQ